MRINHVIKTDQWRCAPQIRPAPHFVVSRIKLVKNERSVNKHKINAKKVSNPAEAVCHGIRHGATKVPVTLVIVHVVKLSPTWITFPYNRTTEHHHHHHHHHRFYVLWRHINHHRIIIIIIIIIVVVVIIISGWQH